MKFKHSYKFKDLPEDNQCKFCVDSAINNYKKFKKTFKKRYPDYDKATKELKENYDFYNSFIQSCYHSMFRSKAIKKGDKLSKHYHDNCCLFIDYVKRPLSNEEKKLCYEKAKEMSKFDKS